MKSLSLCVVFVVSAACSHPLSAQVHTKRGAVVGGLTGAAAGALIGDHNNKAGAGALIGGAVGAITGAAIGNSIDEEKAQADAMYRRQMQRYSRAVSIPDVVTMTRNGLSESVIINHIRENGVRKRPEVSDMIAMHRQGVSEVVITAMQQAPVGGSTVPPSSYRASSYSTYRAPVIVEEHHYVGPRIYRPRPAVHVHRYHVGPHRHIHRHRHSHYRRPRTSFHWGVSVGR